MKYNSVFENIVENKLMDLHTAFVAKILSTDGVTAKVQPLNMIKVIGEAAQKPSPITIPILNNCRYKLREETITYVTDVVMHSPITETKKIMVSTPIQAGDIVFCMCADRDISESKRGQMSNAPCDRHSMSNAVIVGVF